VNERPDQFLRKCSNHDDSFHRIHVLKSRARVAMNVTEYKKNICIEWLL
jgi:hypothetical protein